MSALVSFKYDLADGAVFTATATDRTFPNTSEFSACFEYGASDVVCGDYNEDDDVTASDALNVLRVAVGSGSCKACVCDVNGAGGITTTDALFVLRKAVGQNATMNCPDCS